MITRAYKCPVCGIKEERVSVKDDVRTNCECGMKVTTVFGKPSVLWVQHNRNRQTGIQIYQEKPIL